MGRQLINISQIKGITKEDLNLEILDILNKTKYFNVPVNSEADLPLTDNIDNSMTLVLDEESFYVWHEKLSQWRKKQTISTESRMTLIPVVSAGQTELETQVNVGVADGVISLETVALMVNGMWQHPITDYVPMEDSGKLKIKWSSPDFQLEKDDTIFIIYDIIKLR